jgi:WhiB family redox-sensing transcriptional regulator
MAQGNCADKPPSLFFPSDGVGVEVAKRLCVTCAVRMECLEYALRNRIDHGVWGGTSERERRRILKSRRLQGHPGTELDADAEIDEPAPPGHVTAPQAH